MKTDDYVAYQTKICFLQESIREIEETLSQQLFNIGMNLGLGSNPKHPSCVNASDLDNAKVQSEQPILNVIYENNNSNIHNNNNSSSNDNSNSIVSSEEHVFTPQLDSFEMDHITLQVRSKYHSEKYETFISRTW